MEVNLKGAYKGDVRLQILQLNNSNKVLLNVHGLYGLTGDPGSKSELLGNKVLEQGIASVVHYNSSRDWNIFQDGDWEKMQKAFEGKTFQDETVDLETAITYVIDNSEKLFKQGRSELYIVGNSLGGMLVSSIADNYFSIKKLILAAAGTGATTSKLPVMNTMFPRHIKSGTVDFTGEVLLLQGSEDDVVPLEAGEELLSFYTKASRREHKVIEGAGHSFKGYYDEYIGEIIKFIQ